MSTNTMDLYAQIRHVSIKGYKDVCVDSKAAGLVSKVCPERQKRIIVKGNDQCAEVRPIRKIKCSDGSSLHYVKGKSFDDGSWGADEKKFDNTLNGYICFTKPTQVDVPVAGKDLEDTWSVPK